MKRGFLPTAVYPKTTCGWGIYTSVIVYSQQRTSSQYIYYTSAKGEKQFTKAIHCGPITSILDRLIPMWHTCPLFFTSYRWLQTRANMADKLSIGSRWKTKRFIPDRKMLKLLISDKNFFISVEIWTKVKFCCYIYTHRYIEIFMGGWMDWLSMAGWIIYLFVYLSIYLHKAYHRRGRSIILLLYRTCFCELT